MHYRPGTHIIATLSVQHNNLINSYNSFSILINTLVKEYNLAMLGSVNHNFTPAGFTAVVCLSESHISIHTWPEHSLINMDIYLSNYEKENDGTVHNIYNAIKLFFEATVTAEQIIKR